MGRFLLIYFRKTIFNINIMSMMDGDSCQKSEIDKLVEITGFSKIEIKTMAYLGYSTDQIIEASKQQQNNKE